MIPSYRIRTIDVSPGLVLAPMSGVTTSPFRRLLKELNPGAVGLVISEFISVEGLTRDSARSRQMLRYRPEERPFGIQIFGWDPQRMRDAAVMVQDAGADLVDINCGCPAPKVVRKGGGCELMRQPVHLAEILRRVRSAVQIPLTLKMRSGWDEDSKNCLEIAHIAESEGVEALAVHGRTRSQLYRGLADWDVVRAVAAHVRIPVAGSGDVVDYASADARIGRGVAGVFIGRAAMSNPFVFSDIVHRRHTDLRSNDTLTLSVLVRYAELLQEEFPAQHCTGRLKQLVTQLCKGRTWRADLLRAKSFAEQLEILARARENPSSSLSTGQSHSAGLSPTADETADLFGTIQ